MKIIRLIPDNNYGPFPHSVIVVSKFNFSPSIGMTYRAFRIDGQRWTTASGSKQQNIYVLIAHSDKLSEEQEGEYGYKNRRYRFERDYEEGFILK